MRRQPLLKVGDRVVRVLPRRFKAPVRHGVVMAVEDSSDSLTAVAGYQIFWPSEGKTYWYAAKGDYIEKEKRNENER